MARGNLPTVGDFYKEININALISWGEPYVTLWKRKIKRTFKELLKHSIPW